MKTYYIKIEEQGCVVAVVKVNANNCQEAELKALKALHVTENISEISKEDAEAEFESGNVDVMIDEDGCEIDLDDETDEPSEIYIVKCVEKSGEEKRYQHKDEDSALARARCYILGTIKNYWNDPDSGMCWNDTEYSKITVHKVTSTDDELNDKNCIWSSDNDKK